MFLAKDAGQWLGHSRERLCLRRSGRALSVYGEFYVLHNSSFLVAKYVLIMLQLRMIINIKNSLSCAL